MSAGKTPSKPFKFAVSYLLYKPLSKSDDGGAENGVDKEYFLMVQRPANDANLPNVWGLPAGMAEPSSSSSTAPSDADWEKAVIVSGHQKLGVELKIKTFVSEGHQERSDYILHMRQYEVALADEKILPNHESIVVPQNVEGVTQYQQWRWGQREELTPAAEKGSLCSKLHLYGSNI